MRVSEIGQTTSVSVLSDSRLFRETLSAWLQGFKDIKCVAAADSLQHLRLRPEVCTAQVLLVRARIDGVLGRELAYEIRTLMPASWLIVMQTHDGEQDLVHWIEAGAVNYLHRAASPTDLLQSIRNAAHGRPGCSMSRHTRVTGPSGETTYKTAYLGNSPALASPVAIRELDQAWRQHSGLVHKAAGGPRGIKMARRYDSSNVHLQ